MKVHLKTGKVIEVKGNQPTLLGNGLMRFDEYVSEGNTIWSQNFKLTDDPLIPIDNIEYIEQT